MINLGGYDVLAQPFDETEVIRVISSAERANVQEHRTASCIWQDEICIFSLVRPSYTIELAQRKGISMASQFQNATAAFEAEALPHMNELFRSALRLLLDHAKASDAVQETYLLAWKTFDRYDRGTNCRAWLFQILFNVVRHERRKRFKWLTGSHEDLAQAELVAPDPTPESLTDRDILTALDKLPAQFREVLLLVDVEEFSYKEVADILQAPIGTVMSRLSRARALLRRQLTDVAQSYGLSAAEA